jgi:sarcosine oxidase delta subunit
MKIKNNKSNKEIARWLNARGCKRWYVAIDKVTGERKFKELPISEKLL